MIRIPKNNKEKRMRVQKWGITKKKLLSFIFFALLLGANIISIYIFQEINFHQQNSSNGVITPRQPRGSSVYYEDTTGEAHGVFISGDYAYIGDYDYGLAVIDITDPTNPGLPVYEDTDDRAYGVYVSGDYAYVADGLSGLAVIDISDPTNPGLPIYENTNGFAFSVFVSGDYAYVACLDYGLAVIDISDPTNPGAPVYRSTSGWAEDVYISGDYAYLACLDYGLAVIDISDPPNPGAPVYRITDSLAYGVYVSGDYAYLANQYSGLAVIDISDPTVPGLPIYEDTADYASDVYVDGDFAYVTDRNSGLAIINISDPTDPGTPVYEDTTGYAWVVHVDGDYAYIANDDEGLAVIDISRPIDPGPPIYSPYIGNVYDVYVSGDYAYTAISRGPSGGGLAIIDISDPTNPGTPIYEATYGPSYGVFVSGDYAYIADVYGLWIIDISDPTNPNDVSNVWTSGTARDVYLSGDYAYIADGTSGLAVINISDPTNPGSPVYEDTTGNAVRVYVSGDYAYIADGTSGLAVIDISDPTNPGTPVYEDTTGGAGGVYVSGDYAYVATNAGGLAIINISNPTNPGLPVYQATAGGARGVYVSGDYAYVADWDIGLAIIDISDPTNPGVPVYRDFGICWEVYVSGDYAYIAGDAFDLVIIQVRERIDRWDPVITDYPSDLTVEIGYTGQNLSWTATDASPNTYNITLEGTGVVAGPILWSSSIAVTYNIPDGLDVGVYVYTINFTDTEGNYNTDSVTFTVEDTNNPVITDAPSDFSVEVGYTEESLSWTATDASPNTYTIELEGTGIVAGPIMWSSGVNIVYNIPDGFAVGNYVYTINFTDTEGNYNTDSVTFSVEDTTNPVITDYPSDLTVEIGYTGQSLSWTATDASPNTYNITLEGTGVVAGPILWSSSIAVTYNIPDGLDVGVYVYTINFTDTEGNYKMDSVTFIVEDTTNPVIIDAPSDLTIEYGYTGQSFSWTATDANPDTYNITLEGTGVVAGPILWSSGTAVTYNIPDGLDVGVYVYTINFTDTEGNYKTDSVTFIVEDTTNPVITYYQTDLTVEYGYTGQSFSWTATDANPDTYNITLEGTGIVAGPTLWSSGIAVTYNIPDGLDVGVYVYTINFTDTEGNYKTDSVTFIVEDTTNPVMTDAPADLTVEEGYTAQNLSWTATDANPNTYTIELEGTGIVAGPTVWTSGVAITYNIPDGLSPGVYTYIITFIDESGNTVSDTVVFTVEEVTDSKGGISFGNYYILFTVLSIIGVLILIKRKIIH